MCCLFVSCDRHHYFPSKLLLTVIKLVVFKLFGHGLMSLQFHIVSNIKQQKIVDKLRKHNPVFCCCFLATFAFKFLLFPVLLAL